MEQLSLIKHYTSIFIEEQVLLGNVYFCVLDASRTNIVFSVLLWLQNTNATTKRYFNTIMTSSVFPLIEQNLWLI